MARIGKTPRRAVRRPGVHRNPVVRWVGGDLSVIVCGFEFVFTSHEQARVYLEWFENYPKLHRRQFAIINQEFSLRNELAKLPAHLFKSQNRPKVIKAIRAAISDGGQ
jgi:hypothetical protein